MVSLLLLTAIAGLAVTLGEDYGPSADTPSTLKNPGVYYANPVLYIVTWVNRTGYTFTYLPQDGTSCLSNALTCPLRQILLLLCQAGVRRREGAVDSATLFVFWLLLVLCDIFPFQTLLREALKLVRAEMNLEQGLECSFPLQL